MRDMLQFYAVLPDGDIGEVQTTAITTCKKGFGERPFDEDHTFNGGNVFRAPDVCATPRLPTLLNGIQILGDRVLAKHKPLRGTMNAKFQSAMKMIDKAIAIADATSFDNFKDRGCTWRGPLGAVWQKLNDAQVPMEEIEDFCAILSMISPEVEGHDPQGIAWDTFKRISELAASLSFIGYDDGKYSEQLPDFRLALYVIRRELRPTAINIAQARYEERVQEAMYDSLDDAAMARGISVHSLMRGDFKRGTRTGLLYNIWEYEEADEPLESVTEEDLAEENREKAAEQLEENDLLRRSERGTNTPVPVFRKSDVHIPANHAEFEDAYPFELWFVKTEMRTWTVVGTYQDVQRLIAHIPIGPYGAIETWGRVMQNPSLITDESTDAAYRYWQTSSWRINLRPAWRFECPECGDVSYTAPNMLEKTAQRRGFIHRDTLLVERPTTIHERDAMDRDENQAYKLWKLTRLETETPMIHEMLIAMAVELDVKNLPYITDCAIMELLALDADTKTKWRSISSEGEKTIRWTANQMIQKLFNMSHADMLELIHTRSTLQCHCDVEHNFHAPRTLGESGEYVPVMVRTHSIPDYYGPKDVSNAGIDGILRDLPLTGFKPHQAGCYVEQVSPPAGSPGSTVTFIGDPDWFEMFRNYEGYSYNDEGQRESVGTVAEWADYIRSLATDGKLGSETNSNMRASINRCFDNGGARKYLRGILRLAVQGQMMTQIKNSEALGRIVNSFRANVHMANFHTYRSSVGRTLSALSGAERRWGWTFIDAMGDLLRDQAYKTLFEEINMLDPKSPRMGAVRQHVSTLLNIEQAGYCQLYEFKKYVKALQAQIGSMPYMIFILNDAIRSRQRTLATKAKSQSRQRHWINLLSQPGVKPGTRDEIMAAALMTRNKELQAAAEQEPSANVNF